ncbi:MAG: hypothetical protein HUU50_14765 [Candidatus Brocadiae bacterium]|nr:hypothetical protein [Candidatus Brocadiia bacterium]
MFRVGFPVDGEKPEDSFVILVQIIRACSHSVKGGQVSGLREKSGADFIVSRLSPHLKTYYKMEFEPLLPVEELRKLSPKNMVDSGDSDSGACALSVAKIMSRQTVLKDSPIIAISCSFYPQEISLGLTKLWINRVTYDNDTESAKIALCNKWAAVCKANCHALILQEEDARILSNSIQEKIEPLHRKIFFSKRQEKPYLVSCRPDQWIELVSLLNWDTNIFRTSQEKRSRLFLWILLCMLFFWVGTAVYLFYRQMPSLPAFVFQKENSEFYPCLADAYRFGYHFYLGHEKGDAKSQNFSNIGAGNMLISVSTVFKKSETRILQKFGNRARLAFCIGYYAGKYEAEKNPEDKAQLEKYIQESDIPKEIFSGNGIAGLEKYERNLNGMQSAFESPKESVRSFQIMGTKDKKYFYVTAAYGLFTEFNNRWLIAKFNEAGERICYFMTPEKGTNLSAASCAIDKAGNIYLVFVDEQSHLNIRKLESDLQEKALFSYRIERAVRLKSGSCAVDTEDRLWVTGTQGQEGEERVFVLCLDSFGKELFYQTWGKDSCFGTMFCADEKAGAYSIGHSREGIHLFYWNDNGLVNQHTLHFQSECVPTNVLKKDSYLYISGYKASNYNPYYPFVWKFSTEQGRFCYLKEIALPAITGYPVPDYAPMAVCEDHILVGYTDLFQSVNGILSLIHPSDEVVWHHVYGWYNYEEFLVGFFFPSHGKYAITIEQNNHRRYDRIIMGFTKWKKAIRGKE